MSKSKKLPLPADWEFIPFSWAKLTPTYMLGRKRLIKKVELRLSKLRSLGFNVELSEEIVGGEPLEDMTNESLKTLGKALKKLIESCLRKQDDDMKAKEGSIRRILASEPAFQQVPSESYKVQLPVMRENAYRRNQELVVYLELFFGIEG